jgi:ABC-type uncharacterized transport system involved in gliding motility auxiliary subunit
VGGGQGGAQHRPTWLSITTEGLDTNDVVTSQIDNVWYFAGGAFSGTPADGLKQTTLVRTTTDSALVDGMLANIAPHAAKKDNKASGKEHALAIRLSGKFKTAFPEGNPADQESGEKKEDDATPEATTAATALKESKTETTVVLVGDADMIHDSFTVREMQTPFGVLRQPLNANINFAQNAVEQLAGDNNLIAVRSRATLNRPFTVVNRMKADAEDRFRAKLTEVQAELEETQRKLNELQQNKDQSQRFILSPEQQAELEKFREKEAEARKTLKQVQKDLRKEVDQLETRVKGWNIFAMPAAVTMCGILLAVYKRKLTAAK